MGIIVKMQKYIIIIDIDGTLLAPGTYVMDEEIKSTFKRLKTEGHIVVVATGRSLASTYKIDGIKSASFISTLMGEELVSCPDGEMIVAPKYMDSKIVKDFVEAIEKENLKWTYKDEYEQKTYFNDEYLLKKFTTRYCERSEYEKDLADGKICQLLVDIDVPQYIRDKFNMFEYFFMPNSYVDVNIQGSTKEKVVDCFRKSYPGYKIVAIGDSNNDLDMLKKADISIAMGNSSQDIKDACDHTTKCFWDGGVVYAISNILKI